MPGATARRGGSSVEYCQDSDPPTGVVFYLNVDLEAQGLEAMIEVPTLYRATS